MGARYLEHERHAVHRHHVLRQHDHQPRPRRYFFSTANSTATGNTFTPSATLNHYGFGVFSNGGGDTNTNITIDHNVVGCASSCVGTGALVDDPNATGIAINRNNLQGLAVGISTNATATVDGTCNWWGAASGPTPGQTAGGGPLTTSPWLFSNNLSGPCFAAASVVMVTNGLAHTCALIADGTARCWGLNSNGQLGDGTTTQRLSPVVVKNSTNTGPLTGITQIVAGGTHTCARLSDGTARCWGKNANGQLGDGTTTQRLLPVVVKNPAGSGSLTNVSQLSLAVIYSCARIGDGTARCWGNNNNGVLGDGTQTQRLLPVTVKNPAGTAALTAVSQISVRGIHSSARISDGTARCWGYNPNGQLGDGTTTTRLLPVVVKNPAGSGSLTGVSQIAAGRLHTCARISDGTVRCWGANANGQLGDGTTTQRLLPVIVKNSTNTGSLTGVAVDRAGWHPHVCALDRRHGAVLGIQRQRPARRRDDDAAVAAGRGQERSRAPARSPA